jgi:hypothetical protein
MDNLNTSTTYNLTNGTDAVVRFIPTGFTDGDERLFYVIHEAAYDQLFTGSVVETDVLSDKDIESRFGLKLPIKPGIIAISRTIKSTPNDLELGRTMRSRQTVLEQTNPTRKTETYAQ